MFWGRVSLHSASWPWTLNHLPASASQVRGLQACITTLSLIKDFDQLIHHNLSSSLEDNRMLRHDPQFCFCVGFFSFLLFQGIKSRMFALCYICSPLYFYVFETGFHYVAWLGVTFLIFLLQAPRVPKLQVYTNTGFFVLFVFKYHIISFFLCSFIFN